MAGEANGDVLALAITGSARQLQVALEHLRHAVHPAVAEGAATGKGGHRAGPVAVDAAVLDEAVRLAGRADTERLEPEPDEGREAVIHLGQVDVARSHAGVVPQATCGLHA